MNIECLLYLQKIARMKSISKAASSSHISQSALSQKIQKLEESIGYELLIRSNRGVELTEWGKIVLKYAENIIRIHEKMMGELNNQKNNQQLIKIEAAWTIATYCLPSTLCRFKQKHPTCKYELSSEAAEKIEQDVRNDICEVGFTTMKPSNPELAWSEVISEKVVLAALPGYNIPDVINLEEINNYPLILLKGECIIKDNLESYVSELGEDYNLNVLFELDSTEAVKDLVLKGYGIAFLPYSSVKKELSSGELKNVEVINMSLDYTIYLIHKKDANLCQPINEFLDKFKRLGNKICG